MSGYSKINKAQRTERDKKIVKDRADGLTIIAIGKRHNLSRTRVWSVLNEYYREHGSSYDMLRASRDIPL